MTLMWEAESLLNELAIAIRAMLDAPHVEFGPNWVAEMAQSAERLAILDRLSARALEYVMTKEQL